MNTTLSIRPKAIFVAAALLVAQAPLSAQTRGVSDKEIRIGTLLYLSGALASAGKDARDGMQMRVGEINALGGVGGRMLELYVEDHGYDPKKAVLGTQKLLDLDGIFAMVGQLGTATMLASAPLLKYKDAVNFLALTATALTYEPPQPLMFAYLPSYVDQLAKAMPRFLGLSDAKKVCVIYRDDEFGQEILRGAEAGLEVAGMPLDKAAYKEDPSVFSAQGYFVIDSFINAARAAGPQLTSASFVKALETTRLPATLFGTPEMSFTPAKRIGIDAIRLAGINDGRWVSVD